MKRRVISVSLIFFMVISFLMGCVPPDRRKRYVSFCYTKGYSSDKIAEYFSHNNYVADTIHGNLIYDLENNIKFTTNWYIIGIDDNYLYTMDPPFYSKFVMRKIDYQGNIIQSIELKDYDFRQVYNNFIYFSNIQENKAYYFEDNDFEKDLIAITPEQNIELAINSTKIFKAEPDRSFLIREYRDYWCMINTDFLIQRIAGRTRHWTDMESPTVYKIDKAVLGSVLNWDRDKYKFIEAEKTKIHETDVKSYVLYFDDEMIITFSDNVIYKAYYNGGEKEAMMAVNWDDGGANTKEQYLITFGEFGFACNDVIYSAAADKIFRPADIPFAEA